MDIKKVNESDKLKYRDLLLLADEQMSMIEKYLYRGEMFALYDGNEVKSICVVTDEQNGIYEIKNLATSPGSQRKGYGKCLVDFIINRYKSIGKALYVGTGNNELTLHFYQNCGFVKSHIVKNFFTDYYDHPIYENGKLLTDMIYLKIEF